MSAGGFDPSTVAETSGKRQCRMSESEHLITRDDEHLAAHYSRGQDIAEAKRANRAEMLLEMGYEVDEQVLSAPFVGFVGRLVFQKGVDLLVEALPQLLRETDTCFAFVGAGEASLQQRLNDLAAEHPGRVFIFLGYSEPISHLLEAGVDIFAMPSRYEPCGLNQMYSLRYGTPPVVRRTGGLADTVVDTTPASLEAGTANGFVFDESSTEALTSALHRALQAWADPGIWKQLIGNGMATRFAWNRSAREYIEVYRTAHAFEEH